MATYGCSVLEAMLFLSVLSSVHKAQCLTAYLPFVDELAASLSTVGVNIVCKNISLSVCLGVYQRVATTGYEYIKLKRICVCCKMEYRLVCNENEKH